MNVNLGTGLHTWQNLTFNCIRELQIILSVQTLKLITTELTSVLFGQFGDVLFVENILLRGHPMPQQQHNQARDCGEQD